MQIAAPHGWQPDIARFGALNRMLLQQPQPSANQGPRFIRITQPISKTIMISSYSVSMTEQLSEVVQFPIHWFSVSQGTSLGVFLLAPTCPIEKVSLWVGLLCIMSGYETGEGVAKVEVFARAGNRTRNARPSTLSILSNSTIMIKMTKKNFLNADRWACYLLPVGRVVLHDGADPCCHIQVPSSLHNILPIFCAGEWEHDAYLIVPEVLGP